MKNYIQITLIDRTHQAIDQHGNIYRFNKSVDGGEGPTLWKNSAISAYESGQCICYDTETNKLTKVSGLEFNKADGIVRAAAEEASTMPKAQLELMSFINTSYDLKPEILKMDPLRWKYLIRSAMRGKNIMMTGPAGCGKTMAARSIVNALDRPDFYFNLGATQDPRATLIGNTHFSKEAGTYFSEALFVKAIQTENAVILLDELSRAHPEAHNILMTVLDEGQRYLRLDEADGSPTVKVAPGVTFIATANIGNEYTATRVIDRALLDRFTIVEMETLNADDERSLLAYLYPQLDETLRHAIAEVVAATRAELRTESPRISTHVSTRASVEMAGIMYDGFSLEEAAEVLVYPQYDAAGGLDSERTFVKQLVQKYAGSQDIADDLFDVEAIERFNTVR
jgi:nitric oxide reductase NorQ protein